MPFLDELLELLPSVELSVRRLDQYEGVWCCVLDNGGACDNAAVGNTAAEALTTSLRRAGVQIDE